MYKYQQLLDPGIQYQIDVYIGEFRIGELGFEIHHRLKPVFEISTALLILSTQVELGNGADAASAAGEQPSKPSPNRATFLLQTHVRSENGSRSKRWLH